MTAAGTVLRTLAVLLFWLVLADFAGVLACLFFDIAPLRYESSALPYAVWFVLGAFTGLFVFGTAAEWAAGEGEGEWGRRPEAARIGNIVLATALVALVGLGAVFNAIWWSRGVNGEYFVPDSAPHTITFFMAILLAMLLGRHALVEEPKRLR